MRQSASPNGLTVISASQFSGLGLRLEPVLRAGGRRPLAFHRLRAARSGVAPEDNLRIAFAAIEALG